MALDKVLSATIAPSVKRTEPSIYTLPYAQKYEAKGEPDKQYGAPNSLIDLKQVRRAVHGNLEDKLIDVEEVRKGKKRQEPYKALVPETEKSKRSYHAESYSLDALDLKNLKKVVPEDLAQKIAASMTTRMYTPSETRVLAVANEKFAYLIPRADSAKSEVDYKLALDSKQAGRNMSAKPGYLANPFSQAGNYVLNAAYKKKAEDMKQFAYSGRKK